MLRRALRILAMSILIPIGTATANEQSELSSAPLTESVLWLEKEAHRIIRASKREMNDGTSAFPPQVGIGYEAFWLRDYEYTLEGSVKSYTEKELTDACRLFLRSRRSDGAGVDCVKFDDVFFDQD